MTALRPAVLAACLAVALAGVSRTPPMTPPADDSGRLPPDILCAVYGGDVCTEVKEGLANGTARAARPRSRRQSQQGGGADVSPALLCSIFKGPHCPPDAAPDGDSLKAEVDDSGTIGSVGLAEIDRLQRCSVFGGPDCPLDAGKVYEACPCPDGSSSGCECIPYYQCDNETGEFNWHGAGSINVRVDVRQSQRNPCGHYFRKCCKVRKDGGGGPGGSEQLQAPKTPAPTRPACGVRNHEGVGTRISGFDDEQTKFGEIPWMVAVFRMHQSNLEYIGGGGLIAPNAVLTAAHIFKKLDRAPGLAVRAGEWDSRTEEELFKHQDRRVAQLIVHPEYNDRALKNDLALLVLAEPISVGYHIGTVCLPRQGQKFDGRECLVTGWGKDKFDKDGEYANILRRVEELPVVPHDQCQTMLRRAGGGRLGASFRLNRSFMCAGGIRGKDACTGDGGGPLVCPTSDDDDARYQFAGIVSWGVGCGEEGVPGVYAEVALHRMWIDQTLANLNIQVEDP